MKILIPEIINKIFQLGFVLILSVFVSEELFVLWTTHFAVLQSYSFFILFVPVMYILKHTKFYYILFLFQVSIICMLVIFTIEKDLIVSLICAIALVSNSWLSVITTFSRVKIMSLIIALLVALSTIIILTHENQNMRLVVPICMCVFFLVNILQTEWKLPRVSHEQIVVREILGFAAVLPNKYLIWLFPMLLFGAREAGLAYIGIFAAFSANINNFITLYLQRYLAIDTDMVRSDLLLLIKCVEMAIIFIIATKYYNISDTLIASYLLFASARFYQLLHRVKITVGQARFRVFDFMALLIFPLFYIANDVVTAELYYIVCATVIFILTFITKRMNVVA